MRSETDFAADRSLDGVARGFDTQRESRKDRFLRGFRCHMFGERSRSAMQSLHRDLNAQRGLDAVARGSPVYYTE
jgi:hypothetical protein